MNKKLVYVGFGFPHHLGTHAGYHQIKDYGLYDYFIDCQNYLEKCHFPKNIFQRVKRKVCSIILGVPAIPWYLFKIVFLGLFNDNLVFHFIYGENTFFDIKRFIRKGNKVVCTLHQPLDFFENEPCLSKKIKKADALILVGETEKENFEKFFGVPVVYIPHGICADFYKPEKNIKKQHILLTVGNWLRDYEFADKVYSKLFELDKDLEIHVVSNANNKSFLTNNDRLFFHTGISDEDLKELYCKSEALFLPLIRYTANNSLLEAGATGCNIVISSNYCDNSYLPDTFLNLVEMNVEVCVTKIIKSMNKDYNYDLSKYVSDRYSWQIISDNVRTFLTKI